MTAHPTVRKHGSTHWLLLVPAVTVILVTTFIPIVIMLVFSFSTPGDYGGVKFIFSADAWRDVLIKQDIFDDTYSIDYGNISIFFRSIYLALLTTVVTIFIGVPTAYFIVTRPENVRGFWLFLIVLPFWTNVVVRTLSVMQLIRNEGIVNGALTSIGVINSPISIMYTDYAVIMGMIYVYIPLAVLPIYTILERFDFRLLEAAYDLYASKWDAFVKILLPSMKSGIAAGAILVFIPSIGNYVVSRMLGGGGNMMMANYIELQFGQARNWPHGAALSLSLVLVILIAVVVYRNRMERSDEA